MRGVYQTCSIDHRISTVLTAVKIFTIDISCCFEIFTVGGNYLGSSCGFAVIFESCAFGQTVKQTFRFVKVKLLK